MVTVGGSAGWERSLLGADGRFRVYSELPLGPTAW